MKVVRNIAFPDADEFMAGQVQFDGTYQIKNLHAALRHVTNHTRAIDGGAHVGTWSKVMSGVFERVIAIEPSSDTYECLTWNLTQAGCLNVDCRNIAVGDAPGFVTMDLNDEQRAKANTGARFAKPGGTIPVETIDSWQLPSLGFLKLDIEGSEYVALRGASQTLRRCKPVVLFENKFLWTRTFGLPKDAVSTFLTEHGYHFVEKVSNDQIWMAKAR